MTILRCTIPLGEDTCWGEHDTDSRSATPFRCRLNRPLKECPLWAGKGAVYKPVFGDGVDARPDQVTLDVAAMQAKQQRTQEAALRYDAGKLRYDLIPGDSLAALAEVYTKGAQKYADRNWEKGMSWSRCFGSLMRHAWKFWRGERLDAETGCHHMAMAAWNCFALSTYDFRKIGTDDRPKEDAQ